MNICLYHGVDLDGFCCVAIYAKAMTAQNREYELIPANYGWELPWEKFQDAHVTLIDFSLPKDDFIRLGKMAKSVLWIDHHKSAINDMVDVDLDCPFLCELDTTQAGCELAWRFFFNGPMPTTVHLLGRYDVWDHKHTSVLPYQYGMWLYDLDPSKGKDRHMWINTLIDCDISDRLKEGRLIQRYDTRQNEIKARSAFTLVWEDLRWIVSNNDGDSKLFDSVYDSALHDGMMTFGWTGKEWVFGLYSTDPDIDCGAIAKRHGGGGHPGAAGFRCSSIPFDLNEGVMWWKLPS